MEEETNLEQQNTVNTVNTGPSAKERYDAKKEQKQKAKQVVQKSKERSGNTKRVIKYVIWIVIISAVFYGLFRLISNSGPQGEDFSQAISEMGASHIAIGSFHEQYNSNPPTSGPHYANAARAGFRGDTDIPDENIVHSLEHGAIWISYLPSVPEEVVDELKRIAGGFVIVTARRANETDIALAAWGRLDTFNLGTQPLDAQRIRDFISRYTNKGPEKVSPTVHGQGM